MIFLTKTQVPDVTAVPALVLLSVRLFKYFLNHIACFTENCSECQDMKNHIKAPLFSFLGVMK
jgi:hypothetical protein